MSDQKYYQLGTHTEEQWDELHAELTDDHSDCDHVPSRCVECVDDQLHSKTRGTYLLTDEEAANLKRDPRVKFINIDYKRYEEYTPPPDQLHSTRPDLLARYSAAVKNYREFEASGTITTVVGNLDTTDTNRTGYQLYRCQQKLDPWVDASLADNAVVTTNVSQYGTGRHVDVIVADDGIWIGHPEFQNNSVAIANPNVAVEHPTGYVGGNLLPGNGTCDVLDLVLDAPYYLDPEWFDADPSNRLTTRWDGTIVPVESVARVWWAVSSQRSEKFASAGTVIISSDYTRANCNGDNTNLSASGNHGNCCAALTYGRTQGWAYNANKWHLNLYGFASSGFEPGFDLQKIFHQIKPVNPLFGTKNPTISSNSWGFRSYKDPQGSTWYYTHRSSANNAYTSNSGINWLSTMGTQGDTFFVGQPRWKSEMKTNSLTEAQDELIDAGVIFVVAAGNSNQKQVNDGHPDFNNYITTTNGGTLENSSFFEFGIEVTGTTNRRGFPQQGGKYIKPDGTVDYKTINVGALDDDYKTSLEAKVSYSDRGNGIDCYAPADGTLAASRSNGTRWPRPDTYENLTFNNGFAFDTVFGGTSAACPVAAGFLATVLEHNRDWGWQELKNWIKTLDTQDPSVFYYGIESTTPTDANWTDYESLEGGTPTVLYQGYFDSRFKSGTRKLSSGLRIKGLRFRK